MRRFGPVVALVLAAAVGYLLVVAIDNATAATCADYDTQAEAQRAADTRDGDGDGRYCESLPRSSGGLPPATPPGPQVQRRHLRERLRDSPPCDRRSWRSRQERDM